MEGCSLCKEIIDNRAAVIRQMDCMTTSIYLSEIRGGPRPTPEMAAEFSARATALALCAAAIEKHVNPTTATTSTTPINPLGTDNPQGGAA